MARLETNGGVGGGVDTQSNSQKEVFETTSFLQGANAAYLEHLLTAFEADPAAVGPDWRAFFAGLGVAPHPGGNGATRASWAREDWPPAAKNEWVSALDGDWGAPKAAPAPPIFAEVAPAPRRRLRSAMSCNAPPAIAFAR